MMPHIWSNFELKLLNVDRCRCDKRWRYRNTNSPFSRIILIIDGEAHVIHHGRKYVMLPGKMYLVPCFTFCDYYTPDWFEFYYSHFTARIEGGMDLFTLQEYEYEVDAGTQEYALFERLLTLNPSCPFCPYRKIARRLQQFTGNWLPLSIFSQDSEVKTERNPGDIVEADGIMRQLLAPLLRTAHDYSDKTKYEAMQYFKDVLDFIEANIDKQITLEDLADQCYLSPVYFSNLFYEKLGVRPIQYLTNQRIQKIQTLLICTNKTIKEISEECGFKDTNYLCRVFKNHIGMSPVKYRKEKR